MRVREGREGDAPVLAALAGIPESAARRLVHDRAVRVATADPGDEAPGGTVAGVDVEAAAARSGADVSDVRGFVAFDARTDAVHVTQLAGDADALGELLAAPLSFAESEDLPVEVVVPESERAMREALAGAGFEVAGEGPRFDGERTRRYHHPAAGERA